MMKIAFIKNSGKGQVNFKLLLQKAYQGDCSNLMKAVKSLCSVFLDEL